MQEENREARPASLYLLNQVRAYDSYCHENKLEGKVSCKWASNVQQTLTDYAYFDEKIFFSLGPKSSGDIYIPFGKTDLELKKLEIRKEIGLYNDLKCPVMKISDTSSQLSASSGVCQRVPAIFCKSFPEPPKGLVDEYISTRTVAIASECIVPTLVVSRDRQEKLSATVKSNSQNKHIRWLLFILISIVAGGKVANATTKAFDIDKRIDRRRLTIGAGKIWVGVMGLCKWVKNLVGVQYRKIFHSKVK